MRLWFIFLYQQLFTVVITSNFGGLRIDFFTEH
jgi:hypothetical protein